MSGRVFGYLLFSDQAATSAQELRAALGASAGAISAAVGYLTTVGLVRAAAGPERRKSYYCVVPDPWLADLVHARRQLRGWLDIAARASSLLGPGSHPGADRARDLSEYVRVLGGEFDRLIAERDQWVAPSGGAQLDG
ncbi:hypothetical protein [Cellulomonas hominis]